MTRSITTCSVLRGLFILMVCDFASAESGIVIAEDIENTIEKNTLASKRSGRSDFPDLAGASTPPPPDRRLAGSAIGEWVQMGNTVSTRKRRRFEMMALCRNGNRMVASETLDGPITAYQWNTLKSQWKRMGQSIPGIAYSSQVAMSNYGNYLVTAARQETARVFKWENRMWKQVGKSIDMWVGTGFDRRFFGELAMSDDGKTIAIALYVFRTVRGEVKIFHWNGSKWIEEAHLFESRDLLGVFGRFGASIAMSGNGKVLAVGSPIALAHNSKKPVGKAQVFEKQGSSWKQRGSDIFGKGKDYGFGTSIAMSRDGRRIVIGEATHLSNGYARVMEWDVSTDDWIMVGNDIEGEYKADFGEKVSMSSDGRRVVVSAFDFRDQVKPDRGFSRVFEFNGDSWPQLGNALPEGGLGLSMAGSGNRLAIFESTDIRVYNYVDLAADARVVEIKIKPFKGNNAGIKISRSRKEEVISVGIRTTDDFDAKKVNVTSIRFGPDQAKPVGSLKKDFDFDGIKDMILRFKLHHTGFSPGRQQACLFGEHKSGEEIKGCQFVQVTKAK